MLIPVGLYGIFLHIFVKTLRLFTGGWALEMGISLLCVHPAKG